MRWLRQCVLQYYRHVDLVNIADKPFNAFVTLIRWKYISRTTSTLAAVNEHTLIRKIELRTFINRRYIFTLMYFQRYYLCTA